MKGFVLFLVLLLCSFAQAANISDNKLFFGSGTGEKSLIFNFGAGSNNPQIRADQDGVRFTKDARFDSGFFLGSGANQFQVLDGKIKFSNNGTDFDDLGGSTPKKDYVLNGNMIVWQDRTTIPTLAHRDVLADRFLFGFQQGTSVFKASKSTDVPDSSVYSSIELGVATAQATVPNDVERHIRYAFDGWDLKDFEGKTVYLSFYAKTNKVGTYSVIFGNLGRNWMYPVNYTITTANTWQEFEIPVTVNTSSGTWAYDHQMGLSIRWGFVAGSTYQGTPNTWQAANVVGTSSTVNFADSTSNYFRLAKVRLSVGGPISNYSPKGYTETLNLVERYRKVIKVSTGGVNVATGAVLVTSLLSDFQLPVEKMRVPPNVSMRGTPGTDYNILIPRTGTNPTITAFNSFPRSSDQAKFQVTTTGGTLSAGDITYLRLESVNGALIIDAEIE